MYQSIHYCRTNGPDKNYFFLRDCKQGWKRFKYSAPKYILDEDGEYETLFGKRASQIEGKYDWHDNSILEKDVSKELSVLRDLYYKSDEVPSYHNIVYFDIEIQLLGSLTPSYIQLAPAELTSIALLDDKTGHKTCFIVDTDGKIKNTTIENKTIISCYSERDLIDKFLKLWRKLDPTIVVGWNCIPKDESIWLNNKITTIGDSKEGDMLFNNGFIKTKYPNSLKEEYLIHLSNGKILRSSKDHIFPFYYKGFKKYKNPNSLLKNINELSLENIIKFSENNNIYLKQEKRENNNIPLTYNVLLNELNLPLIEFDEIISNEDLRLLGLLFTDGSINKKNLTCKIYSSDKNLINNYTPIINKFRKKGDINFEDLNPVKNNYSLNFSIKKNKLNVLSKLIFDENFNKKINKTLVSLLSRDQFKSFYSGLIDGDGCIHNSNMVNLCNYECNEETISELLLWNGVYSTITKNNINIPYNNKSNKQFIDSLVLSHSNRIKGFNSLKYKSRKNRISNNFKRFEYDNYDLIRVEKIEKSNNIIEMCDIKSTTGYFNYNGIKTHNCDYFDIPYLYYRIRNVYGEETANMLSPIKKISISPNNFDNPITIGGVNSLDFMRLTKKYITKEEPSYKLNDIGIKYAKLGKIEYEGNLDQLFESDPEKYIDYNIRDVEIIKELENNLQFVNLTVLISHLCHTPYESIYYNTVLNEGAILTYLKRKNIVVHNKPVTYNPNIREINEGDLVDHQRGTPTVEGIITKIDGDFCDILLKSGETRRREIRTIKRKESYAGGFLLDPKPGIYRWLSDFDYASLYPSIIRSLNLGIETLVGRIVIPEPTRNLWWGLEDLKMKDPNQIIEFEILDIETYEFKVTSLTIGKLIKTIENKKWTISANGVCFRTDKRSIVATILGDWFAMRKDYKKKMEHAYAEGNEDLGGLYNRQQHSFKILLNAVYGAFAINSWRFTDGYKILSSAITTTGQRLIVETIKYANEVIDEKYLNSD